jgi:cell division inhibitor SepF
MSAMRKAIQYLGFDVSEPEDYEYASEPLAPVTHLHDSAEVQRRSTRGDRNREPQSHEGEHQDLQRIQTIKPRSYNDARLIGEAFRQGVPVIMNLTEMTDADAKRLVDFSAGLSFGLHGSIERVTTSVFLLSPAHVEIGVDREPPPPAEHSFFNQS